MTGISFESHLRLLIAASASFKIVLRVGLARPA